MTFHGPRFPALLLAVTVVELVAAVAVPGVDQFEGKGWSVRLVVYPLLMLGVPGLWWTTRGTPDDAPPYAAFTLLMLPFWSDTTANWLDLFRRVAWWDDLSHLVHWFLLGAGIGLLAARRVRPRWALLPLVAGTGALLAVGWELFEWLLFIRHGTESTGAYEDTLGDLALGVAGSLAAAVIVGWRGAHSRRAGPALGPPT